MSRIFELREVQVLNTLIFETLGDPKREREFKLKSLKRWGFDLIFGIKDGKSTYFTSETGKRKEKDKYTENGVEYEVNEILNNLPKNKKLFAHIETKQGRAYIVCQLRENGENIEILRVPAGKIILTFFKKNDLTNLINSVRNIGICIEFVKRSLVLVELHYHTMGRIKGGDKDTEFHGFYQQSLCLIWILHKKQIKH